MLRAPAQHVRSQTQHLRRVAMRDLSGDECQQPARGPACDPVLTAIQELSSKIDKLSVNVATKNDLATLKRDIEYRKKLFYEVDKGARARATTRRARRPEPEPGNPRPIFSLPSSPLTIRSSPAIRPASQTTTAR